MLEEEYEQRRQLPQHLRPAAPAEPRFEYSMRPATEADLPSVREIYNHYVLNSSVTFDEKPQTLVALRKKFAAGEKLRMPFLVAQSPSGQLLGAAWVYPWQGNSANRRSVELSVYLGPAATGRGLGSALLERLLADSQAAGIKQVVAVIADRGADASIQLHKKLGFKESGRMGKVGFKFDRWLGTVTLTKSLK
ncbi:MAG TPA: GNAT family N-acetyltransferase [Galbitalea sp.]|nr:GNAT family N-acetyltransferase [Galbitalea sp.]